MKRISLIVVALFLLFIAQAQISPIVPSSTSIANTSVAVNYDWNAFQNSASLGYVKGAEGAIQYENRYLIPELSTKSVQAAYGTKHISVGLAFSYQGYSLYNEMLMGVGLARNFNNKFAIGVQFNYYTAYFSAREESRYRGTILGQVGVSANITPKLTVGFNTFNPFQTNIKTEFSTKKIPSIFSIGTNYRFSKNLVWLTQMDKEVSSNFRLATGFEYKILKQVKLKIGGYGSDYFVPAFGLGFNMYHFQLDLNSELHPILGLTTLFNLKYRL